MFVEGKGLSFKKSSRYDAGVFAMTRNEKDISNVTV